MSTKRKSKKSSKTSSRRKPGKSSRDLLNAALASTRNLKAHLKGEADLSPEEVAADCAIVRAASRRSFYFFAKAVLGFDKMVANPHQKWCDDLQAKFWLRDYLMRLKARGTFKTSIYGEAFILWAWAVISAKLRFFYTSANGTLLDEVSQHLEYYIGTDSESLYALVFGIRRDPRVKNTEKMFNIMGRDESARGASLILRTSGGSTSGVHPHIIIVDDPMDKEDRESATIRKKKKDWFDTLIPLLVEFTHERGPIKKLMFIATRWHLDDLVAHVLARDKENPRKEERFDVETEGILTEGGKPAYPGFKPMAEINAIKAKMSDVFFYCQYQNNPLPEGLKIFNEKKMHFMRLEQAGIVLADGKWTVPGRNFCFFDPSQGKESSDYPAVVWPNLQDIRILFYDAIDEKFELASMIKLLAARNKMYGVTEMVFENNGSSLLQEGIEKAHEDIKHPIQVTGIPHTTNKRERIVALQPHLYNGSVLFRHDWKQSHPEMRRQIVNYPAEAHDDFPDVVEFAVDHIRNNTFTFEKIGPDGTRGSTDPNVSAVASALSMLKSQNT